MTLKDWMIRKLGGAPLQEYTTPGARTFVMATGRRGMRFGGVPASREIAPGCRRGTWVRWEGNTAIATGVTPNGLIAIDVVNDAGETILATHQPWGSMRRATIGEVPEARRKVDVLRRLGYQE